MSTAFEDNTVEEIIELPPDYVFTIPSNIKKIHFDNKIIVIDSSRSVYITLFNNEQENIFNLIENSYSILELTKKYTEENINLQYVIMAIMNTDLFNIAGNKLELPIVNDSLFIYLTDLCNLSCPHCYRNSTELSKETLSLENWIKILDNFKSCGGKEVTISGGEPLLYKDFIELCRYIKSLHLSLTVLSNGTLWQKYKNKDDCINVIKSIDEIQLSIDGYDESSNQIMRGNNNFEITRSNLNWLLSLGLNLSMAITPSPIFLKSEEEKEKLDKFIIKLSEKVTIRLTHKIIDNNSILLTENEEKEYFEFISNIEDKIYPNGKLKRWVSHYFSDTPKENNCGWGNLAISSTGDVYTCNRLDAAIKIGNAITDDMSYLIEQGQKNREITSVDSIEPCKYCAVRYLCNGGCRIDDFIEISPTPKRLCSEQKLNNIYKNMINASKYIYDL